MAIILEGNDSSGKSFLADRIGLPVYRSGGPPLNHSHMLRCLEEQQQAIDEGKVLDRITAISQQIYSAPLAVHVEALYRMLSKPRTLLVYCRPSDLDYALSKHQIKAYDTEAHLEKIVSNYHKISADYDHFMQYYPHIKYDWLSEDLDDGRFIYMLKCWALTPESWEEYLVHANWATIYCNHELLNQKTKYGKVIAIMGQHPLALIKQNSDINLIPVQAIYANERS